MKKIVIIGASSGIGREIAERLLKSGDFVVLCSRRTDLLNHLHENHPQTSQVRPFDVNDAGMVEHNLINIFNSLDQVDLMILTAGTGDLNPDLDYEMEKRTIDTNVTGFTAVVDSAINYFKKQGFGHLAVISSISGLRGGAAAPAYNASKAYQINYLEALHVRAVKLNLPIFITDIRCGLVDTAMAKGEGLFWVEPVPKVASQIIHAIKRRKRVVYVSRRWGFVAAILKILPFRLYSKL